MKTVLIVDDNIKNLDLFKDFVESWGYETVTAQQGKDAISLAERYLPDIILLDVMLPGMSGYEVCRELKENTKTQHILFYRIKQLLCGCAIWKQRKKTDVML